MLQRRPLMFANLDEIMPDVEHLLLGHVAVGNWSLGQVCRHLTKVLRFTIEGSPEPGPHVLNERARSVMKRRLFSSGVMRSGIDVPGSPLPEPTAELNDQVEADNLRQSIHAFLVHPGSFAAHPLLGVLDTAEAHRFQCVHSAHHLSHLIPA